MLQCQALGGVTDSQAAQKFHFEFCKKNKLWENKSVHYVTYTLIIIFMVMKLILTYLYNWWKYNKSCASVRQPKTKKISDQVDK